MSAYTVAAARYERVRPQSPARWICFLVAFAVLGIAVPVLALTEVADAGRSRGWVVAVLVVGWAGLRLALLIAAGEARFFAYFFWLFTYLFLGVAPTVQMRSNRPSSTTPDVLPSLDAVTMWTVVLGLVCFEIGALVAAAGGSRSRRSTSTGLDIRPAAAVALALAGLAISGYYLSKVGLAPILTSREAASAARSEIWSSVPTRAAVLNLSLYLTLIGVGAMLQLRRAESRAAVRLGYAVLATIGLAALTFVAFPVSTPRFTLGTVLFAILVLFGGASSRLRVRATLIATALGLFFVFPIADAFRRTDEQNFERAGFFAEYAANPDYDAVWQVANALTSWQAGGLEAGRQALGVVLFWLPRSIWTDKPLDTGVQLALENGYSTTNLSAPLWAEALANGGWFAVVLAFLVLGFAVHRLDSRVASAASTQGLWVLVGAVLPGYFVILLRGSLLQATGTVAIMLLCLVGLRRRPLPPGQRAPTPDDDR